MKIGQVAEQAEVRVDTVRFYERRGVPPRPERTESGYRTYTVATVERIQFARQLQQLGFTLAEVIDALHTADAGGVSCASERWRLETVDERIDSKIAELRAVRERVTTVMAACDDGRCVFGDDAASAGPRIRR